MSASLRAGLLSRVPRVWLVAGGGWIGRIIQVLAQLVAVRILTQSLGADRYGAFVVLASLNGWFLLSDFSIAISLQNSISERRAQHKESDELVFTAALLSAGAALLVSLLVLALGPWLSRLLLHGFPSSAGEGAIAFYAAAFPSIGAALGGVVYKYWFAHHRGYLANLVPAAGTLLGTLAVWAVRDGPSRAALSWNLFLYYLPTAIFPIVALAVVVMRTGRYHRFRRDLARPLLARAFRFWVFGIMSVAVLQVDYIILSQILPARDIVIYNVATRIFLLVFFVYNALLLALWPVCSEAIALHDWRLVGSLLRRYLTIGLLFALGSGAMVAVLGRPIVAFLVPSLHAVIPLGVVSLLTLYVVVRVWSDTFAVVLQSMNDITPLWLALPAQSLLSIVLQTLGARYGGLEGMIAGLILCFILTVGWYLPLRCYRHARPTRSATR